MTGAVSLLATSKLTFQLGGLTQGNQYGFLNVNGSVALNGNLVVSFVNSFQATSKDNFTVLSSTALSGAFTNVASGTRLATTDGSGTFLVTYNGNTVVLSDFESGKPAAPSSKHRRNRPGQSLDRVMLLQIEDRKQNLEGEAWNEVQKAPSATSAGQTPDQSSAVRRPTNQRFRLRFALPTEEPPPRKEKGGRSQSILRTLINFWICSRERPQRR